jgi:CBS domain-containing protein
LPVTVKDVMTKKVIAIDESKSVKNAAELLKKHRKGALIVLKKNRAIGILTDTDIINKVVYTNKKPSAVKIKDIMSKPIITVKPGDSLVDAARKMKRNNIKRLPVITEGSIVGIISAIDIAVTSPEMLDLLEYRLKSKETPMETPMEILEKETSGICENCATYADSLQNLNGQWLCEDCREELES